MNSKAWLAALLSLLAGSVRAELQFSKTQLADQICEESGVVAREFPFQADGKGETKVLKLAPSCTCTTAELAGKVFAPGDHATVTVHYNPAGKQGPQAVFVDVETETDGRKVNTRLIYRANVVDAITLQPGILYWKIEETAEAKDAAIRVDPSLKPKSLTLGKAPEHFTVELRKDKDASVLKVAPKQPMKPAKEEIRVILEDESGKRYERTLHALIR